MPNLTAISEQLLKVLKKPNDLIFGPFCIMFSFFQALSATIVHHKLNPLIPLFRGANVLLTSYPLRADGPPLVTQLAV